MIANSYGLNVLIKKIPIAIIGTGNIGTDLLKKISRSELMYCAVFIGRNLNSRGMRAAIAMGITVSDHGVKFIEDNPDICKIIFDEYSEYNQIDIKSSGDKPAWENNGKFNSVSFVKMENK